MKEYKQPPKEHFEHDLGATKSADLKYDQKAVGALPAERKAQVDALVGYVKAHKAKH